MFVTVVSPNSLPPVFIFLPQISLPPFFSLSTFVLSLCNFMADLNFGAPSFSLGLDLDFDSDPSTSPPKESLPKPDEQSSIKSKFKTFQDEDEDEDFQLHGTLDPDPPSALKRLRRRPRTPPPPPISRQEFAQILNVEDEIEDFSSQEERGKGERILVL